MSRSKLGISRRSFLATSGVLTGLYASGQSLAFESKSPNEKLKIAIIGPGGKGESNLSEMVGEHIMAIVDVDERRAAKAYAAHPEARKLKDYRLLFEKPDEFDAVVVSTPDHHHALPSMLALMHGKAVYCEKPLSHTVWEARTLADKSKEKKIPTQMGTQIHAGDNYRRVVELIQAKVIGEIKEVHVFVGKGWGGGVRPTDTPAVPAGLDWDLWLGGAPERPYHPTYVPANWRRWWDFGTGTLGDMGCHYMDLPFWALGLTQPTTVEAFGPEVNLETAPLGLKVEYEFPAVADRPALKLTWYDGEMVPEEIQGRKYGKNGVVFIGTQGEMFSDYGKYKLYPEDKFKEFTPPMPTIAKSVGHHKEWLDAIKYGTPTLCNFGYSGNLTESVILGTVAYRAGEKLLWDGPNLKTRNSEKANKLLNKEYRKGWTW